MAKLFESPFVCVGERHVKEPPHFLHPEILFLRREVGVQDPHQSIRGHDLDQIGNLFDAPFGFEILVDRLLLAILEVIPSADLLHGDLPLDHVHFLFELLHLGGVVGPQVVPVEHSDVPDFVDFARQLDVLFDVVDPGAQDPLLRELPFLL